MAILNANRGVLVAGLVALFASASASASSPIDFETDQLGGAMGNGQILDTEFTSPIAISSPDTGVSHLGPAIFDSTPGGPNAAGGDPDLLVGLGNILILQNTAFPANDGSFFSTPNDEADFSPLGFGTVVFDFATPLTLLSIDLIDINGGINVDVFLTDGGGNTRTYNVPAMWTHDVTLNPLGWDTLDMTTLAPQLGEGGATATGFDTGPFDASNVLKLSLKYSGSAALDNLVFIPEPSCILLLAAGGLLAGRRRRH